MEVNITALCGNKPDNYLSKRARPECSEKTRSKVVITGISVSVVNGLVLTLIDIGCTNNALFNLEGTRLDKFNGSLDARGTGRLESSVRPPSASPN